MWQVDQKGLIWKASGKGWTPSSQLVRIWGFDFDHTLVKQKSGAKFAQNAEDWLCWCDESQMRAALEPAIEAPDCQVVIFTNQAGIEKKKQTVEDVQARIENVLNHFSWLDAVTVCIATRSDDHFRKPGVGMWDFLIEEILSGKEIDLAQSLYVGDAAGRPKNWKAGTGKDFSASDRKFAFNLGLPFQTPEEFFLGEAAFREFSWGGFDFDPEAYLGEFENENPHLSLAENIRRQATDHPVTVLMCGPPSCGKTTFVRTHLPEFTHINRDTLKSMDRCEQVLRESLQNGQSAIIDNTNPDRASRKRFIDAARSFDGKLLCIHWRVTKELALHLNQVRVQATRGQVKRIPTIVYHMWFEKYEPPIQNEGFDRIYDTLFVFNEGSDPNVIRYLQFKY